MPELGIRWRKVLRDLWDNKIRTVLVVLSISVGVFAVGTIMTTSTVVSRDMNESYQRINPSSAMLYVSPVDDDLVAAVGRMAGVAEAEGRARAHIRVQAGDEWVPMQMMATQDFSTVRINRVYPQEGAWPPGRRQVLIERGALALIDVGIGDTIVIESYDGTRRELEIAGTTHDMNQFPAFLSNTVYAYVTPETMEWLGMSGRTTELSIIAEPEYLESERLMALVEEVKLRVEKSGHTVWGYWLPTPGKHPADEIIQPIIILLGFLGVLALVLSGFLVVNTIAAILTQQVRHIGIMKAIGARRGQIVRLYLGMVVVFGVLSLLVAVPLGAVAAAQFTAYMANMINFDVQSYSVPANVLAVEVAVGLAVPLLAALVPVIGGTRITVREAMSGYGLASIGKRQSLLDRLLGHLRGVSRPLLLSLRNTFRRKARVTLTLITLTLGGGIFIGVMSVHASMMATLDTAIGYWNHEVSVDLRRPYLVDRVIGEAMAVPGVKAAEMWGQAGVERVRPDGSQSQRYFLVAPPAETDQIEPILIDGRWLLPEDENAIVLNTLITRDEPDIRVGDEITLRMDKGGTKIETTWRVVGIVRGVMTGHIAYVNYPYYARVTGMAGRANALRVQIDGQGREAERQMAQALEAHLNGAGLDVHGWSTTSDMRAQVENQLNIIVVMLMGMSVIMALVGALGLMGTMSINVLERTREIGVMRAIGASGRAVLEIVIVEGMIIGGISWGLGTLLAVPLSKGLSAVLGAAVIHSSLDYVFDVQGMLLWLVLALALAALASYLPARRASQITVRDVLAYE